MSLEFIKCIKGNYVLTRNYRDAFNLDKFVDKYFEEYFDKYTYIVGDISSGILRLKGFDEKDCSNIDNYIETSCAFGCPFYVLKRVKDEDEYQKYVKNHHERDEALPEILCRPAEIPRRSEWPDRGSIRRPHDRKGI